MNLSKRIRTLLLIVLTFLVLGAGKDALADDIILSDLAGKSVSISSYKGKPVILFFWTTWCPYCRKELKALNQRYPAIAKEGIVLLGVNVNEPTYKVQKFFEGYTLNFKMLLDKFGLLADEYSLMGVPTYVFLDKAGREISQTHAFPENYRSLLFN